MIPLVPALGACIGGIGIAAQRAETHAVDEGDLGRPDHPLLIECLRETTRDDAGHSRGPFGCADHDIGK